MSLRARRFQGRGILLGDALYIERRADRALLDLLLRGEAAYVLGPRQVGKSNLRIRVERQLSSQGVRCAAVDLSGLDRPEDAVSWYYGILVKIARDLGLPVPLQGWLESADQPAAQRFIDFLRDGVLAKIPEPIVLFFDEIDATYALPFGRDTFFLALRSAYQERGRHEAFCRLTFCLVGVSRPADLVAHADMTPFGILRQVFVEDFTLDELRPTLPLLAGLGCDPERLLRSVFSWTHGQPAMTQQICEELCFEGPDEAHEDERARRLVEEHFLKRGAADDPILSDVARRFARSSRTLADVPAALALYRRILKGERMVSGADPATEALRLVGLAAERHVDGGVRLGQRNRIFAQVFDLDWIRSQERARPFVDALFAWLDAGRDAAYLLRGRALDKAREWAKDRSDLTSEERDLLDASIDGEREEADSRRAAELSADQARLMAEQANVEREQRAQAEARAALEQEGRRQAEARATLEQEGREQAERREALEKEGREHAERRREQAEKQVEVTRLRGMIGILALVSVIIVAGMSVIIWQGRVQEERDTKTKQQLDEAAEQAYVAGMKRRAVEELARLAYEDLQIKKQELEDQLKKEKSTADLSAQDADARVNTARANLRAAELKAQAVLDNERELNKKERELNKGVVSMLSTSSTALLNVVDQANKDVDRARRELELARREIDGLKSKLFTANEEHEGTKQKLRSTDSDLTLMRLKCEQAPSGHALPVPRPSPRGL